MPRVFAAVLMALAVLISVPADAGGLFDPMLHADVMQPAKIVGSGTRPFRLTFVGFHASLLHAGKFVFPTIGLDWQMGLRREPAYHWGYGYSDNGEWTSGLSPYVSFPITAGVGMFISDDKMTTVNLAAFRDTNDANPHGGRWGVKFGIAGRLF